ncbi:MAG TPA: TldD/PmbA family protein [Sedimentibacter sp.]|nr:TldD/PmbA family protein [Tissierellia bacterium]HOA19298.1 TldD/PmbA family protein [Sedimentibacter sp.]HOG62332.1 TldD/PmbA family protein [Sedimentibacter sp.]HPB79355.1 TldD/PmbA family protein [Sedimentibacter sp.]HPY55774.1 TldD/PmbA family protein [Sedimentibacter sp.]
MLSRKLIENTLTAALSTGGDFAEIFVEDRTNNGIVMIGGKVESTMSGRDYGVGIRIFKGFNSVYAYTNKSDEDTLIETAKKAAQAVEGNIIDLTINLTKSDVKNINIIQIDPSKVEKTKKVQVMKKAYDIAFNYDELITQVSINYTDYIQNIMVANSEGLWKEDTRVRSRLGISSVASKDGEMQSGFFAPGASKGYEFFENLDIDYYAKEASRIAVTMVKAKYSPSGRMPVIIDNGFGGVIFHEACGHGLEATSVAKGLSVFAGKIGQQIASPIVTAIDDGSIPNEWGSFSIDDEGTQSQRNVLIENGILKGYMIDKLNARRMNMDITGSSRRQSYRFPPTSRMSNTFIDNGSSTPEEIIANTEKGLYAKHMGGGSVNPATGEFNFAVMEGYIIENGKIKEPVRGATLIGKGMEVLNKIDMVGNNLLQSQGMCGSVSGSIPANVGQPMIRVSELTVGGREGE